MEASYDLCKQYSCFRKGKVEDPVVPRCLNKNLSLLLNGNVQHSKESSRNKWDTKYRFRGHGIPRILRGSPTYQCRECSQKWVVVPTRSVYLPPARSVISTASKSYPTYFSVNSRPIRTSIDNIPYILPSGPNYAMVSWSHETRSVSYSTL